MCRAARQALPEPLDIVVEPPPGQLVLAEGDVELAVRELAGPRRAKVPAEMEPLPGRRVRADGAAVKAAGIACVDLVLEHPERKDLGGVVGEFPYSVKRT